MSTYPQIFIDPINVSPYFADFNIDGLGPGIEEGPTQTRLLKLVHEGRCGRKQALFEFAWVMYHTLREDAFEAFQRAHGTVESSFREWFYEKLCQFFEMLLFDILHVTSFVDGKLLFEYTDFPLDRKFTIIGFGGEFIQPDEIEHAFEPSHNANGLWLDLIQTITDHPKNRLKAAREWLAKFGREHRPPPSVDSGWTKNRQRDRIILNGLANGMSRMEICQELDKFAIPVTEALQKRGLTKWMHGWHDFEGQNAIHQLLKKVSDRRLKPVKGSTVSN